MGDVVKLRAWLSWWDEEKEKVVGKMLVAEQEIFKRAVALIIRDDTIQFMGMSGFRGLVWLRFTGRRDKSGQEVWEGDIVDAKYCPGGVKAHRLHGCIVWSESHDGWGIEDHGSIYRLSAVPAGALSKIKSSYESE